MPAFTSLLRERWMLFGGVAALGKYLYSSISMSRSTMDINHWLPRVSAAQTSTASG